MGRLLRMVCRQIELFTTQIVKVTKKCGKMPEMGSSRPECGWWIASPSVMDGGVFLRR